MTASAEFFASPIVARDLRRHHTACRQANTPSHALLASLEASYETLDRVLVVDASQNQHAINGVGNLFGDYLLWFALAVVTRRA
eukprot:1004397-Prymnesium_polylepis.1